MSLCGLITCKMVWPNSKWFLGFQEVNLTFSRSPLRLKREKERAAKPFSVMFSPTKSIAELYCKQGVWKGDIGIKAATAVIRPWPCIFPWIQLGQGKWWVLSIWNNECQWHTLAPLPGATVHWICWWRLLYFSPKWAGSARLMWK